MFVLFASCVTVWFGRLTVWIWLLPEASVQNEANNIVFMCWTISDMNKAVWEMIFNVLLAVIFL